MVESFDKLMRRQTEIWEEAMAAAAKQSGEIIQSGAERIQVSLNGALNESLGKHAEMISRGEEEFFTEIISPVLQSMREHLEGVESLRSQMVEETKVVRELLHANGEIDRLEDRLNQNLRSLAEAGSFIDTANALADSIAGRYRESNTELVDLNRMRRWRQTIPFTKMQDCGNDYIFIENFDSEISCPESLCVSLCRQHVGIGADGIVLMEPSAVADVRMRSFNRDGSEGRMAGNNLRCVAKYLYDKGYVRTETISVETAGGIRRLKLFCRDGRVSSVTVNMGKAEFEARKVPVLTEKESLIDSPVRIGGKEWKVSCLSVGNPHCVTFVPNPDILDLETLGPQFEHDAMFPERVNTEFVRVVSRTALRMRVWERGSGETLACGTGACASLAVSALLGKTGNAADVLLSGGKLFIEWDRRENLLYMTGPAAFVFDGTVAL
jgi:carbamoyl-phosphate synthase large subunit